MRSERPTRLARPSRPAFETLEGRQLLASLLVTNVQDSGAGSLRQAILDANASHAPSGIDFAIPGGGVHAIAPATALPQVLVPLAIDATTEPGYAGSSVVAIDGSRLPAPTPFNGPTSGLIFFFGTGGSSVRGLAIERFSGPGIVLEEGQITVRSSFIGVDPTGAAGGGNAGGGIEVSYGAGDVIGGPTAADGNVISGNGGSGITVTGTTNAVISHNLVGTDASGMLALGNFVDGVTIRTGSTGTTVSSNTLAHNGRLGLSDQGTGTMQSVNVVLDNGGQVANVVVAASSTTVATATGQSIQVNYTLTNHGPQAATNVRFILTSRNFLENFDLILPPPVVTLSTATTTKGTITPGVSLNNFALGSLAQVGTLAPGESATVSVALSVVSSGSDTLVATASSDQPTTDPGVSTSTTIDAIGASDLAVTAPPTPAAIKVGQPSTFTFQVTNRDPSFSVTPTLLLSLDALAGGTVAAAYVTQGSYVPQFYPVAGRIGLLYANLSGLGPGESATVTVVVVPARSSRVQLSLAAYSASNVDPNPGNNFAIAGTTAGAGPVVSSVAFLHTAGRYGSVLIAFDTALNKGKAQDLRNYRLTAANGTRIAIRSATYNPKDHTVRLQLSRPYPGPGNTIALVVGGPKTPGIIGSDGSKLINGVYTTTLTRG